MWLQGIALFVKYFCIMVNWYSEPFCQHKHRLWTLIAVGNGHHIFFSHKLETLLWLLRVLLYVWLPNLSYKQTSLYGSQVWVDAIQNFTFILKFLENWMDVVNLFFWRFYKLTETSIYVSKFSLEACSKVNYGWLFFSEKVQGLSYQVLEGQLFVSKYWRLVFQSLSFKIDPI